MGIEAKTSPRRVSVAMRRAKVLQLRAAGATYDQILAQFPDEYRSRAAVVQDVQRALVQTVGEPAAELRALYDVRLEMLWVRAMQVLSRQHLTVSNGKVMYVTDASGQQQPLHDDAPILAAIREARQINESQRKLHGADAPARVEVMTDGAIDAEIRRLAEELDRAAAANAAGAATAED